MSNSGPKVQKMTSFTKGPVAGKVSSVSPLPMMNTSAASAGRSTSADSATDASTRGSKKPKPKFPAKHAPFYGFPVEYRG